MHVLKKKGEKKSEMKVVKYCQSTCFFTVDNQFKVKILLLGTNSFMQDHPVL